MATCINRFDNHDLRDFDADLRDTQDEAVCLRLGLQLTRSGFRLRDPAVLLAVHERDGLFGLSIIIASVLELSSGIERLECVSLEELVRQCLDMDMAEARLLNEFAESPQTSKTASEFHVVLNDAIRQMRLHTLFSDSADGLHHRRICPRGYNDRTGQTFGKEIACWRADFRAMAPEQQMVAATIVWLYQSGPDSTWLRRVPCRWLAHEALRYMKDAGNLSLWLRLIASYPGW